MKSMFSKSAFLFYFKLYDDNFHQYIVYDCYHHWSITINNISVLALHISTIRTIQHCEIIINACHVLHTITVFVMYYTNYHLHYGHNKHCSYDQTYFLFSIQYSIFTQIACSLKISGFCIPDF